MGQPLNGAGFSPTGGAYGPNIRHWNELKASDLGQTFVAVDPSFFAPGFEARMADFMDGSRALEPVSRLSAIGLAGQSWNG